MNKKILKFLVFIFLFFFWINFSFWNQDKLDQEPSRWVVFEFIADHILTNIPESYNYIELYYVDIKKTDKSYKNMQKVVYTWAIPNKKSKLNLKSKINAHQFFTIIRYITWYDFISDVNSNILKSRNVKVSDLIMVKSVIESPEENYPDSLESYLDIFQTQEEKEKMKIFFDVYYTMIFEHLESEKLDKNNIIYWWIEGLANWSWDKYSVFFPPSEAKDFNDSLSWEFEWIWAYIDMEKPWILKIISPIVWSPAEKSWLKWWDIIVKINDFDIIKSTTITEAVSKIKWPAWTKVKLIILRDGNNFEIEVIRDKIIIKDVEYKKINNDFFYIQIKMFWEKVFDEFTNSLDELKKSQVKKLIIDLRNNPWWYLEQATSMLSYFIEKWEKTAVVKYKDYDINYYSFWFEKIDFKDYQIFILVNTWTASASEIMAWTLKDYYPNIKIIWENTFWKWSVQTIKTYYEWSSLKYTIAKWFTGKNQIWIDKIWIKPDIEIVLDEETFKKWLDNQLDYILNNY